MEAAQRTAGHADRRTTKLYGRRGQKVLFEAMERVRYQTWQGCTHFMKTFLIYLAFVLSGMYGAVWFETTTLTGAIDRA